MTGFGVFVALLTSVAQHYLTDRSERAVAARHRLSSLRQRRAPE
jgi:hypothetical protein